MKIHKTSIIHPSAKIDQDVKIGQFCIIDENVKIGKGCHVYPYVHIMKNSINVILIRRYS